jgi:23S rRNA (guanosine2251-2'-O)-methyltransferase
MIENEYVYGKNPVLSLLTSKKRQISRLYIAKDMKADGKLNLIIESAKESGIIILWVPHNKIDSMTDGVHQGVLATVSPVETLSLSDFLNILKNKTTPALVLILDGIEDPYNFGSIIRSAAAAGVDGIIFPKRRSSGLTGIVEKASAGTIELVPLVQTSNLNNAIEKLKENNFWIVGTDVSAKKFYFEHNYNMNCAFVLGNEGSGISALVKKNCDFLVKIPMQDNVNSLNVSNSSAVLIYEVVRQRMAGY